MEVEMTKHATFLKHYLFRYEISVFGTAHIVQASA